MARLSNEQIKDMTFRHAKDYSLVQSAPSRSQLFLKSHQINNS